MHVTVSMQIYLERNEKKLNSRNQKYPKVAT